jgi:hypothetical protein
MVAWWCRFREKGAMQEAREEFKDLIDRFIALQFLFDKQWKAVKVGSRVHAYCFCCPVCVAWACPAAVAYNSSLPVEGWACFVIMK